MNSNKLNVLTYGYLPWRYLPNWLKNIKQFFRNIKYAYQRITRGYCDQDAWGLDEFYSELFYQTLNHLADNTSGAPVGINYDAWKYSLREMAEHFYNTQEDAENPIAKEANELSEKMYSYITNTEFIPDGNGYSTMEHTYSDEDAYNKTKELWLDKYKEANDFRVSEKNKALDMLKEYYFSLWD